ncbi:MAG: hypothetical protein LBN74_02020 [Prevotella sp.]|jgi:hypothetical protein|nr:hypothetical protein [Prevotella sp.]
MFDFLVKWKIDSAFKKNERNHVFRNMESMKNILILFSYKDFAEIEYIAKDLKAKGKNVVMWTVFPSKKNAINTVFDANVRAIYPDEKSIFNIVSWSVSDEFHKLKYDTIMDLTTTDNDILKYLLAINTSDCSIGISKSPHKGYNFIVLKEEDKTLWETYNEIKFYLNNVR